jgi:anti-sigma regulatory factor (Ser/Thr protein kinase)
MHERIAQRATFIPDFGGATLNGRLSVSLPSVSSSIYAARRAVDAVLDGDASDEFTFALRLVVSELMTNAIIHGSPGEQIRLDLALHRDHAHVSVCNQGAPLDMAKLRRARPGGGRGLEIVAAVAERWGIDTGRNGTTITARVPRQ